MTRIISGIRAGGKLLLCGCASTMALGVAEASAQTTRTVSEVEQVIVTARRKEENAQNVPVSVSVQSGAALQRQSVRDVFDLQRTTPGLTITPSAQGAYRPTYELRGQRTAASRIFADPAVVIYVNEVGSTRAAGSVSALFDLESVQVLKGPQGTLFGRNSTGGAILVTTRAPTSQFEGYGLVRLGNYGHRAYEGVVNLPASEQLMFRFGYQAHRRGGYQTNTVLTGLKAGDEDYSSYRISARVKPNDSITSDFLATYFYSNVTGYESRLSDFVPAIFPVPALIPAFQAEFNAARAGGFYTYRSVRPARFKNDVKAAQNTTVIDLGDSGSLLGDAKIKNVFGYKKIKDAYTGNVDYSPLLIVNAQGRYRGKQFSEELQLQGGSRFVDYVLGGFYSIESGNDFQNTVTFNAPPQTYTDIYGKNTSYSAFAHGNFNLNSLLEGLSFSAGGRLTRDKREIVTHTRQLRPPTAAVPSGATCSFSGPPAFPGGPGTAVPIANFQDRSLCAVPTSAKFTEPTYDIGLNYQIDPDHLVYIAHRHGYRSGVAANGATPPIRPEKVDDIEVGSKNQLHVGDAAVRLNLVGYYGWYKDLQRSSLAIVNGAAASLDRNAAKAHVYGLESELNVRFNPVVSVNAAYTLTIAKYDDFSNTFATATGPVTVDNTSAEFSNTPKHAFNVNAVFDLPLAEEMGEASLSLGYSYQSKTMGNDANSRNCGPPGPGGVGLERWCLNLKAGRIKAFSLVNGRADWRKPLGAPFDVAVFGTNLLNKKYIDSAIVSTNVFGFATEHPGPPRMVGVELRVPFGAEP